MNMYERVALSLYLSSYPVEWSYDHVLEVLEHGDDDRVLVWAPFKEWTRDDLCVTIDESKYILEKNFVERTEQA